MSTFVDPYTRLSLIAGTSTSAFQIPNSPGQPVGLNGGVTSAFGVTTFNSAMLNENQFEDTQYGMLALQRSINGFDGQISYFTRYDRLHYSPDPLGDLLINGVASDVVRQSYTNGIQADGSYQNQSGAHHPHRLFLQRRTGLCRQYFAARARGRWNAGRCTFQYHRQRLDDRLSRRRLCAGRMEGHRQVHYQRRPALRPDVAIRQRQPAQPAPQLHVQTFGVYQVPRRVCALLHAAGAGGGSSGQYRFVQQHHRGGAYRPGKRLRFYRSGRIISTPASIRIFRSGAANRRRKTAPTSISASTPITKLRPISSTTVFSARLTC